LIYVDPNQPTMIDNYNLTESALNRLPAEKIRPSRADLERLNSSLF
jgi:hypothetical protein